MDRGYPQQAGKGGDRTVKHIILMFAAACVACSPAWADDETSAAKSEADGPPAAKEQGDSVDRPKTMSGMSILGNEEAPKSLVIVPWKSSQLGDDIGLSDTLGDRAQPVDKDVFLRELEFYEIRAGDQT